MEDLFADIFRTIIDYWMGQESINALITFVAALELAIQTALTILDKDGTVATVEGADDED